MSHSTLHAIDARLFDLIEDGTVALDVFTERARELIARGASLTVRDEEGNTALMRSTHFPARVERVAALLDLGATPSGTNTRGEGALHAAALADNAAAIDLLVAAGCDPNARNVDGGTPLRQAAMVDAAQAVLALGRHGAALDALDGAGRTPLMRATDPFRPMPAAVGALLSLGLDARSPVAGGAEIAAWAAKARVAGRVAALAGREGRLALARRAVELGIELDFGQSWPRGENGLREAARHGDAEAVGYFLALGLSPLDLGLDGRAPIHLAARSRAAGAPEAIARLSAAGAACDDLGGVELGRSPLMLAAEADLPLNAAALLDAGASLDGVRVGRGPRCALNVALEAGSARAAGLLLDRGASIWPYAPGEDWSLIHAARANRLDLCEALLARGAPVDAPGSAGRAALMFASASGNDALAQRLVAAGADVSRVDHGGWSALTWAAFSGKPAMCSWLLGEGAAVDQPDSGGATALCKMAARGDLDGVRVLLAANADPNLPDLGGRAALAFAATAGNADVCVALLEAGAHPLRVDVGGWTPILLAANAPGGEGALGAILDRSAALGPPLRDGRTVLHLALTRQPPLPSERAKPPAPIALLKKIIERDADVGAVDMNKNSPLHLVAAYGYPELASLLRSHGATLDARNAFGATPLMEAASSGNGRMVEALLAEGADASLASTSGRTALVSALTTMHLQTDRRAGALWAARSLIDAMPDANVRDRDGRNALHWAASALEPTLVRQLLSRGADANARANDGARPLTLALEQGHALEGGEPDSPRQIAEVQALRDVAVALLDAGADVQARGADGASPLEIAAGVTLFAPTAGSPWRSNREELAALLISRGARALDPAVRKALSVGRLDDAAILEKLARLRGEGAGPDSPPAATPASAPTPLRAPKAGPAR